MQRNSSGESSSGRPVGKLSRAALSRGVTIGPGEAGTEDAEAGVEVPFFLVSSTRRQ